MVVLGVGSACAGEAKPDGVGASGAVGVGAAGSGAVGSSGGGGGSADSGSAGSAGGAMTPKPGDAQIRVEWADVPVAARASPGRTPCNTPRAPSVAPTTTWGVPD